LKFQATRLLALAATAAIAFAACSSTGASGDWASPYDKGKAKDQAKEFVTYGIPDDWANYGESIRQFCEKNGFACTHTDTDMSSLQEITNFDAEKSNPVALVADIGIQFGPIAEQKGVVPSYLPPNAATLPAAFKSKTGGWVGTFVGVPGYNVNVTFFKDKGIAVPTTWADLIKPEYKGLVGIGKIGESGTATTSWIAMTYAAGGSVENMQPGIDFGKKLVPNIDGVPEGKDPEMERGEVPIQIKYDFNLIGQANRLKEKGIEVQTVIPSDGSIYAASALMANKHHTARMDVIKMFMEWVLSDEGQTVFARFGARPVRYVLGDLALPDDAKTKWLPDSDYAAVKQVDLTTITIDKVKELWTTQVLGQ
jgi:putative spermidine/putrescine transport system substrate-binding protein